MAIETITQTTTSLERADRKERTAELIAQASAVHGSERDRLLDEAIRINIPVARTLAARYRNRGESQEDLDQVACMALTRVVHNFTPDRGADLLVFAVPSILGELKRYFRDASWAVRPPRRLQELRPRVAAAEAELAQELGREPTIVELAENTDSTSAEVREAILAGGGSKATSLDEPRGSDGSHGLSLGEVLPDEHEDFERLEDLQVLAPAWRGLKRRDQRILRLRFYDERTQQQIADELGVSQVQVSRLLRRILEELRGSIAGSGPAPRLT